MNRRTLEDMFKKIGGICILPLKNYYLIMKYD